MSWLLLAVAAFFSDVQTGEMLGLMFKARYAANAGDFTLALSLAERAVNLDPAEPEAAFLKVEVLREMRSGQPTASRLAEKQLLKDLRVYQARFPLDYRFPKEMGVFLVNRPLAARDQSLGSPGDYLEKAIGLMEKESGISDLEKADAHYYLGIWHYNERRFFQAGEQFTRVTELETDAGWALYYAALAAEKSHQLRLALKTYRKYRRNVDQPEYSGQLPVELSIRTLETLLDDSGEALDKLTVYLKEQDFESDLVYGLVERFHQVKQFDKGLHLLEYIPRAQRKDRHYRLLAEARISEADYATLRAELEAALAGKEPKVAGGEIVSQLLDTLLLQGDFTALVEAGNRYIKHPVMGLKAHIFYAYGAALHNGDTSVWESLRKERGSDPRLTGLFRDAEEQGLVETAGQTLVQMYMGRGDWANAERRMEASIAEKPERRLDSDDLAVIYYLSGRVDEAFKIYEELLAAHPDNAGYMNNYGYFLSESDRELEKARDLVTRAVQMDKNNGAYLDSLGWIHYKLGDLIKAEAYILKALSVEPDDPEKLEHLGYIYDAQGKPREARKAWSRSLQGFPDNYRTILDKLDPP
ncbi:MAG: tetratricopeptide repeat protein [Acidobacteriota bacterium]|nr:tetratricopeptide repeat protein [Acidobacteriota bacterium]